MYESLEPERRQAYGDELMALVADANRSGDETVVAPVEYAEVVIRREDAAADLGGA